MMNSVLSLLKSHFKFPKLNQLKSLLTRPKILHQKKLLI